MEKLRRKTIDSSTEKLVVTAFRQGIMLSWDRYEKAVPLCGFGRLSVCCTACTQGPCRVNPFEEGEETTTCGRSREITVAANFLRLVANGVASQMAYAGGGGPLAPIVKEKVIDKQLLPGSPAQELFEDLNLVVEGTGQVETYFRQAARLALVGYNALAAIAKGWNALDEVAAGGGVLQADRANLLLIGAMCRETVAKIREKATGTNAVAMCGAEGPGLDIAGNYGSQEVLLLSGLVDAVVTGTACVSPGFLTLAEQLKIPVYEASEEGLERAVAAARERFEGRRYLPPKVEFPAARAVVGFGPGTFRNINEAKWSALLEKYPLKGIALIGGCNNVKATQDQGIVYQARELASNDVLVVATGCAAAALARAGLMDPSQVNNIAGPGLAAFLGALGPAAGVGRLPAVWHCGTCWETPLAVEMAWSTGLPFSASFPEISRPAAWAMAVALVAMGVPTYVAPVLPVEGTTAAMEALSTVFGGKLLAPVEALTPSITAKEVAAALMSGK